ncbi:MAG: AMP-binding protein, partial [Xanthomonadales bacterium]|nr:AMP-binding protein [Xanthomonadales bacterium]
AISTGRGIPGVAIGLKDLYKLGNNDSREVFHHSRPDDVAAIVYTSGRSGNPRGVVYRQKHFSAQVDAFREGFEINHGEVSFSANPMFSILDAALGLTTVIARVDPSSPDERAMKRMLDAVEQYRVNNIFLPPSILEALSFYVEKNDIKLPIVRRIITFGASPRLEVLARLEKALHDEARIRVPYGSAECFPVSVVTNHEVDRTLVEMMECGEGVCVGKLVDPNEVKIVAPSEHPFGSLDEVTELPPGMPGEILVSSPACTDSYWRNEEAGQFTKIPDDDGRLWHRMGDIGSLDGMDRLWFCGPISQRIDTGEEVLYPDQAEGIFNQHPDALRTALVGVGEPGKQLPVLCVELRHKLRPADVERVHFDLLQLAQSFSLTRSVRTVMFHPGFPLDPRNPSAIRRDVLARWAARKTD